MHALAEVHDAISLSIVHGMVASQGLLGQELAEVAFGELVNGPKGWAEDIQVCPLERPRRGEEDVCGGNARVAVDRELEAAGRGVGANKRPVHVKGRGVQAKGSLHKGLQGIRREGRERGRGRGKINGRGEGKAKGGWGRGHPTCSAGSTTLSARTEQRFPRL